MAQLHRLARGNRTLGRRVGDRAHRTRQIGGVADRRHREFDRGFAIRPDDALEAQPQCCRVAGERQLDGFAGQHLTLAGEQQPRRAVTWSRPPRGRPAGLPDRPLANRPRRSRFPCFTCFIWSRSGIANSFNRNPAPARRVAMRRKVQCEYGNCVIIYLLPPGAPAVEKKSCG
jgi:hypothetical protein